MDERVEKLLVGTSKDSLTKIARGVLGDNCAIQTGPLKLKEIDASHSDQRTIGIIKVSSEATCSTSTRPWSTVVKVIDPTIKPDDIMAVNWISTETEQKVYELGLFQNDAESFRSAKCYLATTVEDDLRTLWLEDLSGEIQPPWNIDHYLTAANHLGQFNGATVRHPQTLPFDIYDDAYFERWGTNDFESSAQMLSDPIHSGPVRDAFRDTPVSSAAEFASLTNRVLAIARFTPHGLAFGDSHARNMFPRKSQTIGIDWAGLTNDPIGTDVGVLIGSGTTFGIKEAQMVIAADRDIFDSYLSGLRDSGWSGDRTRVRVGFFAQFAGYLGLISSINKLPEYDGDRRPWIEQRFGVPFDEIPSQVAPVIARIPSYVDELNQLLD